MKNLVFTVFIQSDACDETHGVFNEHQELYEYAIQKSKKYADKCNADFIVVDDDSAFPGWSPIWQRFVMFTKFQEYDKILYVDADLVITDIAPNIFDIMDKWKQGEFFASLDYETIPARLYSKYFNAGIIACKRSFCDQFTYDEVYDEMKKWKDTIVWDQEALNALVKKKCDNYIDLGRCWNTMSSNIQTVTYGLHYINWHKRRFNKKLIEEYEMKMHGKEHYIDQKVNTFPIFWKRFDGNIISAEKAYDRIMNNMQIS